MFIHILTSILYNVNIFLLFSTKNSFLFELLSAENIFSALSGETLVSLREWITNTGAVTWGSDLRISANKSLSSTTDLVGITGYETWSLAASGL
jgi:hypothetical protein